MATDVVRVALVDDHAIARGGIRLMLETVDDILIVAEAATVADAWAAIEVCKVDVAIVDISMPGKSGLDLLRLLRTERPGIGVLMLSAHPEEAYAMRALKGGAAGYLTKDVSIGVLVGAVRKAARGGNYFSPSASERLVLQLQRGGIGGHEGLSTREFEVMMRLAAGAGVAAIGETLFLSPKTISTYRSRILEKLGMRSNAELARYVMEEGLM